MTSMSISATDKLTVKRRETCKTCTNPLKSCLCAAFDQIKKIFAIQRNNFTASKKKPEKKFEHCCKLLKLCIENCFVYVDIDFSQKKSDIRY